MGAVVAGTTHGILSAVLIVYEMTDNYEIILPIMVAAGVSSAIAQLIDPADIYNKKLIRRGEQLARGHDMHCMEHIMVRDVMIRDFPAVRDTDTTSEIVRMARANSDCDSLLVLDGNDVLVGVIRRESLNRVLEMDVTLQLVNANDIAVKSPISVRPDANLLEALRDFGARDVEILPVHGGDGKKRRLVGILRRADVMRRYRTELLRRHS
ncbi:MAG: CBS domain-containing protein [Planctomycetota bacterium]